MSYFDISGATFDENLRKLETSDPAHADVFNALLGQLINNDVALKEAVTKFAASKNEQALFLLNLHKDGKKYGVHFDNYDVTPSSNGTRLFDAVGMAAAPSTNTVRAVNDFDGKGCFAYLEVNGSVDENGEFQVQYIKDIDNEFSRTKYDTWCLYLTQYVYRKFDSNGEDTVISDTNRVRITKIEDYDDNSSAVYVDNGGQKFSTASTTVSGVTCPTMLSTMPWNTGGCDDVLGSCGSPTSNASGKEPYILFGVEMSSGFWEPKGNTVMKIENHVMRPYICYDCTKITTAGATTEDWIALGYVIPDNKGSWKYISKLGYSADDPEVRYPVEVNASSSNGYADGCYTEDLEKAGDGQREVLGSGGLDHGAVDGRRIANLNYGLGSGWWPFAARLSACGRCGRRAAA